MSDFTLKRYNKFHLDIRTTVEWISIELAIFLLTFPWTLKLFTGGDLYILYNFNEYTCVCKDFLIKLNQLLQVRFSNF